MKCPNCGGHNVKLGFCWSCGFTIAEVKRTHEI